MQPLDQPLDSPSASVSYPELIGWWERHRLRFNFSIAMAIFLGLWVNEYFPFFTWRDLPFLLLIVLMVNWLYCTGLGIQTLLLHYGLRWSGHSAVSYLLFTVLSLLLCYYVYTIALVAVPGAYWFLF